MTTNTPKPCPWCPDGGRPTIVRFHDDEEDYMVVCEKCSAFTRQGRIKYTQAEAIADWNHRASDARVEELIHELGTARSRATEAEMKLGWLVKERDEALKRVASVDAVIEANLVAARQVLKERDEWRKCAERLANHDGLKEYEDALAEFDRLAKGTA